MRKTLARLRVSIKDKWRHRRAFLSWPLETWKEKAGRNRELFSRAAAGTDYPFRAMRYWWVDCAIADEAKRLGRPLTILDAGCSAGQLKMFLGKTPPARWIGVDWLVNLKKLTDIGYDELYECDLDRRLPLPDHSVDVIVFLHVIEHLPRPSFTMSELSRVLRPGGKLMGGSPIAPKWIAQLRQWQHQRDFRRGLRKSGDHIHSFWPSRWCDLAKKEGLTPESLNGAFFSRWSGSPLENCRWWVRLNQLWGGIFPSLGAELYLIAQKIDVSPSDAPQPATAVNFSWSLHGTRRMKWAGVAAAACLAAILSLTFSPREKADIASLIRSHQDGNDIFYLLDHPSMVGVFRVPDLPVLRSEMELHSILADMQSVNTDPHFIIAGDHLKLLGERWTTMRIVETLRHGGTQLFLVSGEGYGKSIRHVLQ